MKPSRSRKLLHHNLSPYSTRNRIHVGNLTQMKLTQTTLNLHGQHEHHCEYPTRWCWESCWASYGCVGRYRAVLGLTLGPKDILDTNMLVSAARITRSAAPNTHSRAKGVAFWYNICFGVIYKLGMLYGTFWH